ncbi:hypothetical protein [Pedobacter sp. MR22-3]|uniref:hypothetical protein n=1 Tax=Pedobacter sp. MR22-3 TaxID=2994552 RepID=UPI0022472612|nr:hypothetical protein [Pedobacter sp. MR22-3]MCX2584817.1 hypothetical protein [Pedobacter sp. MR22-3]
MYTAIKNVSKGLMAAALGLVLVLTGSAFKSEKTSKLERYQFRYTGPSLSQADVEEETYWTHDESAPVCDNEQEAACTITVYKSFVNEGTTPTLKSSLNISASNAASTAYVSGSSDNTMDIINRSAE